MDAKQLEWNKALYNAMLKKVKKYRYYSDTKTGTVIIDIYKEYGFVAEAGDLVFNVAPTSVEFMTVEEKNFQKYEKSVTANVPIEWDGFNVIKIRIVLASSTTIKGSFFEYYGSPDDKK